MILVCDLILITDAKLCGWGVAVEYTPSSHVIPKDTLSWPVVVFLATVCLIVNTTTGYGTARPLKVVIKP